MENYIYNIILGIVQGLTEYLPVSSSGHIELAKYFLGYTPKDSLTLSVVLHVATVISTLIVLWKEVARLLKGLFQFAWNEELQFSLKVVISMLPAAVVGLLFDEQIEQLFEGQIILVGLMLWLTGALLFLADRAKITNKKVSYKDAFLIGLSQAVALLPGVSRSGSTISTSVLLKIDKEEAARFSFLMVIPLILGKLAKDLLSGDLELNTAESLPLLAGFFAALIVGVFACSWMLNLVKKGKLLYFSIYCFVVGGLAILAKLLMG